MRYLILLLLFSNAVFGQMKPKETYTVYVNYPDYSIKATVSNKVKNIDVDESLLYYWYSSNKIIETKGGYDGKILNGSYTSFYLSSNLKEKGQFKKGIKNGEWITWFEGGKIHEISTWKKGVKSGIYKTFDDKGNKITEADYKNNKLNGCQTEYKDGKVISEKRFKNGLEIIPKEKKDVDKKSDSEKPKEGIKEADSKGNGNQKVKKTFKEKLKSIFKKKDKKSTSTNTTKEKPKSIPPDTKTKKTFKEKVKTLFKKKEKSPKTEKPKSETK
jgi:hypothetical protein